MAVPVASNVWQSRSERARGGEVTPAFGRLRRRSVSRTSCVRRYSTPASLRPAITLRTLPLHTAIELLSKYRSRDPRLPRTRRDTRPENVQPE